ncbi:MAG TPA: sterol desaturase family protein [Ohtaekwangia sp.]|nr:sterol desaturase family protein [Ohtaekwangia sp.]
MEDLFYFLDHNFWNNGRLALTFVMSLVIIVFVRYLFFAWAYKTILEWLTRSSRNKIMGKQKQIRREIWWAFVSTLVFVALACIAWWLYQQGLTRVYEETSRYPLWYLIISPVLLLVLYETYYYWLHRWMHSPKVFRVVHRIHHESLHPTVFTSFAFHPLEAFLQLVFFPLIVLLIPFHYITLLIVFTIMSVSAVVNHSGVEIFRNRSLLNHVISSTHHDTHHKHFNHNFGLYFTWWDKWMKTEKTNEYFRTPTTRNGYKTKEDF